MNTADRKARGVAAIALFLAAAGTVAFLSVPGSADDRSVVKVCADPNNLPFSNEAGEGFENEIGALLAADQNARLEYVWWAQRRGFFRNTLNAGRCDVVLGAPVGIEAVDTTSPYYRSSYVFLTRSDRHRWITSFDDPRLRTLRIGVQTVGDDYANPPAALALSRRGIVDNVAGYSVLGDHSLPEPQGAIIDAVAKGDVDVAVVWGPLAGHAVQRHPGTFAISRLAVADDGGVPLAFDIAMAVRRGDARTKARLEAFLKRSKPQLDAILARHGVPR